MARSDLRVAVGSTSPEDTLLAALTDVRGAAVELARVAPHLPASLRWRAIRLSEAVTTAADEHFPGVGGRG